MEPFEFSAPHTLAEALDRLADDHAMALAGGTAVIMMLKERLLAPHRLVWLGRVAELRTISIAHDGGLRIGAGCTLAEITRSPIVQSGWPAIARTAGGIGNVRVRAVATLGGHLVHADPRQDLPPLLLALGARVSLKSPNGSRAVPLDGFFLDYMDTAVSPGELLTAVTVPPLPPEARALYMKFTPRSLDDFPTVGVAGYVERGTDGTITQARIALAGAATTPVLVRGAEAALTGRRPTPGALAAAADASAGEAAPLNDERGTPGYKRAMCRVWTRRCLAALLDGPATSRRARR